MKKNLSFILFVLFLSLVLISPGLAQRQTGSLEGKVSDPENSPLPGVTVTISSPSLLGTREFVTTDTGHFRFVALSPGTYAVKCELSGFKILIREDLIVSVGKTATVELTLEPSTIEEEITVTATAPVVDVKSSKVAVTYTKELLTNIPMNRSLTSIINTAPGAVPDGSYSPNLTSVHGSPISQNQYALDGLNTTDPLIAFPIAMPDISTVDEMEMEIGAHPAEVGGASGAFINVVTRSGGNEFHGEGTLYYFNESLVDSNFSQEQLDSLGVGSPSFPKNSQDFSLSLGGPILKDKLWFFSNGRYTGTASAVLGFPLDVTNKAYYGMGKLTYQLTKNIKLMGYYNYRKALGERIGASQWFSPEATRKTDGSLKNINTQVSWILGPNAFLDIRSMWVNIKDYLLHYPEATHQNIDDGTGMTTGAWRWEEYGGRRRWSSQASFTLFVDDFIGGDHEVKLGGEIEKTRFYNSNWAKEPIITHTLFGSPYAYGDNVGYFEAWGFPPTEEDAVDAEAQNDATGYHFYIQDAWTIKDRLTLNLGLRYDQGQGSFPAQYVAEVPYWLWLDPVWFGRMDIPKQDNVLTFKMLAPRVGLVYDIFGNGKTIAKASYSVYSDAFLITSFTWANPNGYNMSVYVWADLDWNGQRDAADFYLPVFRFGRGDLDYKERIDQDPKSPYWQEAIVGIDHELLPDFRVGVSYIYKTQKNIWEDTEKNNELNWAPTLLVSDPGYDGVFGTSDDAQLTAYDRVQPQGPYFFTNIKDAYRKYRGMEFVFEKRMSHKWQFLGSVVYSKTWGTMGNYYFASIMGNEAFDNPNWMINRDGRLDTDRPLIIKLQGTYQLPYGINLSAYFIHSSGTPYARQVAVWSPGSYSYVTVNAETQGKRRNPSWNDLSLRVEKEFSFGDFGKFGLFVDVYNALNNANVYTSSAFHGYIEPDGSFRESPSWQRVTGVSSPRYVKVGVRFTF